MGAEIVGFFKFAFGCSCVLALVCVISISLPQSKLKDALMPVAKVAFALICGLYVISPIDLLPEAALGPFGLFDDFGAFIAAIMSIRSALTKPKEQHAA